MIGDIGADISNSKGGRVLALEVPDLPNFSISQLRTLPPSHFHTFYLFTFAPSHPHTFLQLHTFPPSHFLTFFPLINSQPRQKFKLLRLGIFCADRQDLDLIIL